MLELGIAVNIFASQVQAIMATKDSVTIRTIEPVPFLGDYVCAEISFPELHTNKYGHVCEVEFNNFYELFEQKEQEEIIQSFKNDEIREDILMRGCAKIQKELRGYVNELLQCQCRDMGRPQGFTNIYHK